MTYTDDLEKRIKELEEISSQAARWTPTWQPDPAREGYILENELTSFANIHISSERRFVFTTIFERGMSSEYNTLEEAKEAVEIKLSHIREKRIQTKQRIIEAAKQAIDDETPF